LTDKKRQFHPHITVHDVDAYKREILATTVLVKIEVAASILSCSEDTVIRRIKDGRITAYNESARIENGELKVSQGTRILASELQDYVRSIRIEKNLW
jgi:hypothetical protein